MKKPAGRRIRSWMEQKTCKAPPVEESTCMFLLHHLHDGGLIGVTGGYTKELNDNAIYVSYLFSSRMI